MIWGNMSNLNVSQLGFNALNNNARQVIFDLVYPVGSYIYIDSPDFDTVAKVEAYYGGHWERVADGTFIEAGSTPGTHEPGLPNITGRFECNARDGGINQTGVFFNMNTGSAQLSNATNIKGKVTVELDASRRGEDPIYGRSTTVQPKSQVVYIYHRLPVQNS